MMRDFVKSPGPPVLYGPVRDIRVGPLGTVEEILGLAERIRAVHDRLRVW